MIERYTRPAMGSIWEMQNKFEIWKEIEVLACEAHAEMGKIGITKEEAAWIREPADFRVERVETSHDAAEPVGFTLTDGLTSMGIATDTGTPTSAMMRALSGKPLVVLESNHDIDML